MGERGHDESRARTDDTFFARHEREIADCIAKPWIERRLDSVHGVDVFPARNALEEIDRRE
jgi:hypothetical protein